MDILIPLIIIGTIFSIIIHEIAHGWVADRLGDPTARLSGRLTLNPIPHIDILGTIIVPLIFYLSPLHMIFGWAKPVPVDPYNLKNPKKDLLLISLAGPGSNLVLAVILSIFYRILIATFTGQPAFVFFTSLFVTLIGTNTLLAIFNLIPIGLLDGEKILAGLLPDKKAEKFSYFMERYGRILMIFLIFPIFRGGSLASIFVSPIMNFVLRLLIPGY